MVDTTDYTFGFYPLMSDNYTFTFDNPGFSSLPVIVTSISEQAELSVDLTFDSQ